MNKIFKSDIKYIWFVLLIMLLANCTSFSQNVVDNFEKSNKIKNDEVILIGQVHIDPPFTDSHYSDKEISSTCSYRGFNKKDIKKMIHIWVDAKLQDHSDRPNKYKNAIYLGSHFTNRIIAKLNQDFYVKFKRKSFYILEMVVLFDCTFSGAIAIPVNVKVDVKPDDQAIYIGNINYTRDEFYSITNAKLVDNFDEVKEDFEKKFGYNIKIRKSLIKGL